MVSLPFVAWFSLHRTKIFYCLMFLVVFIIGKQSYKNSIFNRNSVQIDVSVLHSVAGFHSYSWFIEQINNNQTMSLYYRHATAERNSSYPFISGDTFRGFADHIFDETKQTSLASLAYGDTVFVKPDKFREFFGDPFNSIKIPFVLITHNSDYGAPDHHKKQLNDPKLLAWFASNPNVKNHSKLIPIPIGMANTRWYSGNIDQLTRAFLNHRKPWSNRTTLLYVNFALDSNRNERKKALDQASKIKGADIVRKKITFEMYLQQIGNAKFVLSPPGNGLDCHRTWEALLMGAAPVVLTSGLDPLFAQIPSIIIHDWSRLTDDLLLSYNFSSSHTLVPDVISARYWRERLLLYRNATLIPGG